MASASISNVPESGFDITMKTTADLSTGPYLFVKGANANEVALAGSGDVPLGVLQDAPLGTSTAPLPATVRCLGFTRLKAGGTISQGNWLKPTTGGTAVASSTDHDIVGAQALEDAVSGDIFAAVIVKLTVSA